MVRVVLLLFCYTLTNGFISHFPNYLCEYLFACKHPPTHTHVRMHACTHALTHARTHLNSNIYPVDDRISSIHHNKRKQEKQERPVELHQEADVHVTQTTRRQLISE